MKKIIAIVLAFNISGCASMFTGTSSVVNVTSYPAGAECDITGHKVVTPNNVTLKKSASDLSINCVKDGYDPGSARVESTFNGVTILNIFWGLGVVVGLLVDFSTGAAWNYSDQVNVVLPKKS
ncbi:MAG: hypothetical protein ACXWAT_10500 [Methylobacter sp.]